MSLITLADALDWCGETETYFTINAANDGLVLTSSSGGPVTIDITDGTYEGSALATALQSAMNANTTLTGTGSITFAVSYSSTTRKFTISAGTGKTIAYTNTGSDAGLTFGFNQNHAAAVSITSDIPAGDSAGRVEKILDMADGWAKRSFLFQTIEAGEYIEYHNGGSPIIFLSETPVITLRRVTCSTRDGISLVNSNTDMAYATVKVDSTAVSLTVVGGSNAGTSTVDFATYDDLGEIATAINALGTGWTAALSDATFTDYPYTELIQTPGIQMYEGSTYYLQIPDNDEPGYILDPDKGQLHAGISINEIGMNGQYQTEDNCWPLGIRNVRVEFRGGYETVPAQIQTAIGMLVKAIYQRDQEDASGASNWTTSGISKVYESLPPDVKKGLASYRRESNTIW